MIFQKIARLLKSEINGNSWHVGDLLPSEAELAVRYNVSRNTLRKELFTESMVQEDTFKKRILLHTLIT
ncbi:GntR family transcriptional regulator [Escherichia coli]|nr:GntR family transcriptional regulator [Escherichia coli]